MSKAAAAVKRLVLGRPMAHGELGHTLLPKVLALPIFSSDPLSSVAYATQEILLVLGLVGVGALVHVIPISFAVAALLAIVVTSYRQTVRAYPQGGGAYRVSRENIGLYAGLLAGSALLLDYTMTVAVSTTAGVDAIVSAAEGLADYKVSLVIAFIAFVMVANLRGVKESGTLFAFPTYGFVLSIYSLLATGFVKCLGGCPQAESAHDTLPQLEALSVFLILKAFAAGTTALTGVEAIADGVPAFRYPKSKNAATTLAIMATFSITMFLGISWLANQTNVVYTQESERTVLAQIAHAVFGEGPMFYVIQVMTAAILILAANTAFQDFPRLSSILAQDRLMPRQLMNRGDRLVFSNGVVVLALLASLVVWIFDAELNKLIQLYLVGVFVSFTLSQTGMVLRRRKLREPGWRPRAFINGFGATVTGIVLCVVIATKFTGGAWIIVTAIPILVFIMHSIKRHYDGVAEELGHPERRPPDLRPGNQHMVLLVNRVDAATERALGYVRSTRPADISAVTFDARCRDVWMRLAPDIPLEELRNDRKIARLVEHLHGVRTPLPEHDFLTLVIPEVLQSRNMLEIVRRPGLHRLKAAMLRQRGIQVLDVPVVKGDIPSEAERAHEPARNFVCILVSGVQNATLNAVEYAETLSATDIRAVTFGLDPEQTEAIGNDWTSSGIPHPLEIEDSPFRDIGASLVAYISQFNPDGLDRVVTVVLPEFVVKKTRHQILHGQTALIVKRRLLFERGVVVVSVPYHLER